MEQDPTTKLIAEIKKTIEQNYAEDLRQKGIDCVQEIVSIKLKRDIRKNLIPESMMDKKDFIVDQLSRQLKVGKNQSSGTPSNIEATTGGARAQKVVLNTSQEIYSQIQSIVDKNKELSLTKIVKEAYSHFSKYIELRRCEGFVEGKLTICDSIPNNSGDSRLELEGNCLYDFLPFRYIQDLDQVFPNSIVSYKSFSLELELGRNHTVKLTPEEDSQEKLRRFLKFLKYFANVILLRTGQIKAMKYGLDIVHISSQEIEFTAAKLEREENGAADLANDLRKNLINFTNSFVDRPKGILFYGPPRTGKTYTATKIQETLNLFKIYPNMSAADFSQGIVGHSEKMIDAITKRSDVIPWELCLIFIDEIDSLVPNRMLSNSNQSQNSIIGQLLSIIDGNKKKLNLLIFATTNRLQQMDPAFNQRMDIKIFLGVPNFKGRLSWIDKFVAEMANHEEGRSESLQFLLRSNTLKSKLVSMTTNYSADAMKKCLSQICLYLLQANTRNLNDGQKEALISDIIYERLIEICKIDNLHFGRFHLPKIIRNMPSNFETDSDFRNFHCLLADLRRFSSQNDKFREVTPTRRILVDMSLTKHNQFDSDSYKFQFQVELEEKFMLDDKIKGLLSQIDSSEKKYTDTIKTIESTVISMPDNLVSVPNKQAFLKAVSSNYSEFEKMFKHRSRINHREVVDSLLSKMNHRYLQTYYKSGGFSKKEDVLKVLIKMALELNLDYVLLIDLSYFIRLNLNEEHKMAEELSGVIEETKKYNQAMFIFDMDPLCEVVKQHSQQSADLIMSNTQTYQFDNNEITFTENITRPLILQICLDLLMSTYESQSNHWVAVISPQTKLSMTIKEKLAWPKNKLDFKFEEGMEDFNREKQCSRCLEMFTDKTNKVGACMEHRSDLLYLETEYQEILKLISKNNEKNKKENARLERDDYSYVLGKCKTYQLKQVMDQINSKTINASHAKWLCCGKSLYEKEKRR